MEIVVREGAFFANGVLVTDREAIGVLQGKTTIAQGVTVGAAVKNLDQLPSLSSFFTHLVPTRRNYSAETHLPIVLDEVVVCWSTHFDDETGVVTDYPAAYGLKRGEDVSYGFAGLSLSAIEHAQLRLDRNYSIQNSKRNATIFSGSRDFRLLDVFYGLLNEWHFGNIIKLAGRVTEAQSSE